MQSRSYATYGLKEYLSQIGRIKSEHDKPGVHIDLSTSNLLVI